MPQASPSQAIHLCESLDSVCRVRTSTTRIGCSEKDLGHWNWNVTEGEGKLLFSHPSTPCMYLLTSLASTVVQGVHRYRTQTPRIRSLSNALPKMDRGEFASFAQILVLELTSSLCASTMLRMPPLGSNSPNSKRFFKITIECEQSTKWQLTNHRWICLS